MTAHTVASTFDSGFQRLAVAAFNIHQDRVAAQAEAALDQRDRNLSVVGKVAARVRRDADRIEALEDDNARLRAELSAMRMRALRAEGQLEDVKGALRTLRSTRAA
ncbi:outer membrane murein-binding lipoprotein Lpp [Methylorubrum extorquens]